MKELLDKNGEVLESGDLVIHDDETGKEKMVPERVEKYNGIWYMVNVPNLKGTLFNLANFTVRETDDSVTLVDYTKYTPTL